MTSCLVFTSIIVGGSIAQQQAVPYVLSEELEGEGIGRVGGGGGTSLL